MAPPAVDPRDLVRCDRHTRPFAQERGLAYGEEVDVPADIAALMKEEPGGICHEVHLHIKWGRRLYLDQFAGIAQVYPG
jgi:hypothetical protein